MRSICDLEDKERPKGATLEVEVQGQKVKPNTNALTFVGEEGLEPSTTPLWAGGSNQIELLSREN